jgi:glycosyltransferase involved in cell wall biosynthesis
MNDRLDISVVVIARNEERNIAACLQSLAEQDYPREHMEIVVVDNASTDSTPEIIADFALRVPVVRRVVNARRGVAASRNFGVLSARHGAIAFIDADCVAQADWLTRLAQAYVEERARDASVAAVGGPNICPADATFFRRAVDVALSSFWGHRGSVQNRAYASRRDVDHLPTLNIMLDRVKLLELGLYDEGQGNISEDVDMSHRMRAAGYRLIYEPAAVVAHRWRTSLAGWVRSIEVYGKGRSWLMRKDARHVKPVFFAPMALLACFAAAPLAAWSWWLAMPAGAYLAVTATIALLVCITRRRTAYVPAVFAIYVLTHLAYAVGQLHGMIVPRGSDTRD